MICPICLEEVDCIGNNPEPLLSYDKLVCDRCNFEVILPIRMYTDNLHPSFRHIVISNIRSTILKQYPHLEDIIKL